MKYSFIFILLIIFTACNTNNLYRFDEDPNCTTTIEGYFSAPNIWDSYYPAIVKKGQIVYGNVISKSDKDIIFVERKSGIFHSPDTLKFPIQDIETIIDSEKNCIYGAIPNKFAVKGLKVKMYLIKRYAPELESIFLELEPNKSFSYCVAPGTYGIDRIEVIYKKGIDESLSVPFRPFIIKPNTTNYIGNVSLLVDTSACTDNVYKIPFKNLVNNSDAAVAGFLGGVIGGVIYAAVKSANSDVSKYYYFKIENDSSFIPISKSKFRLKILK